MSYAVVIPIYKSFSDFNEYEKLSFSNNCDVFNNSIVIVVLPLGLKSEVPVFENEVKVKLKFVFFDDEFFNSIIGYNKLMTNQMFYFKFLSFDYIFICQIDVWIFENKIEEFEKLNYSYIGGVHFRDSVNVNLWNVKYIIGGVNGGASLRKVKDHIKVLKSSVPWRGWAEFREFIFNNKIYNPRLIFWYYRNRRTSLVIKDMASKTNEDLIFYELSKFISWFKLPKHLDDQLMNFSWDVAPWVLFDKTDKLPMACHAWFREDFPYAGNLQFWKDKIIKN
jgi:hypothetical protein